MERLTQPPILTGTTVTQTGSETTTVVANAGSGVISTFGANLASDAKAEFIVTNDQVSASSMVMVNVVNWPGTWDGSAGIPVATLGTITSGQFTIVLHNTDDAAFGVARITQIAFAVL